MASFVKQLRTGDGRLLNVAQLAEIYKDIYSQAVPKRGKLQKFGQNNYGIASRSTTIDVNNLESIETARFYSLSVNVTKDGERKIDSIRCVSNAYQLSEAVSVTSKNGRFTAKLKVPSSTGDSSKQCLEIWERSRLLQSFDTSEIDAHGPINTDPAFSNFTWSTFGDQDKLLYVCQPKRPKYMSFFKRLGELEVNSNLKPGEEYNKREDWGECLKGIEHTMIAILDVADNLKITTIDVDGFSLGNPQWLDNGRKIVSVAYQEKPRRTGLIYHNNKAAKLMIHDWRSLGDESKGLVVELKEKGQSLHDPRVNHSGDKMVYLSNSLHGAHFSSVKIVEYDFETGTSCICRDVETKVENFFIENLPDFCFSEDDQRVLFVASDYLRSNIHLFDLKARKLETINFPTNRPKVLDFQDDIILALGSDANATPGIFASILSGTSTNWHMVEESQQLEEVEYEIFRIPAPEDDTSFISCLLVSPRLEILQKTYSGDKSDLITNQNQLPTVVNIHGGPHSQNHIEYLQSIVFYARSGLRTLFINYRGSTGVSQKFLKSLLGKVGELDVKDCLHAIRFLVGKGKLQPNNLIIRGGSHGGFLAAHMCCQEEFKFTSAILRNPVINMATLHEVSDIPDWCYTEALGHEHYDPAWQPNQEELRILLEKSPMSKVSKVQTPTLMMLGTKDLRVPMFQGERWVDKLKAQGVETLCKVYDDEHALGKPNVVADENMTSVIWILDHLNSNN